LTSRLKAKIPFPWKFINYETFNSLEFYKFIKTTSVTMAGSIQGLSAKTVTEPLKQARATVHELRWTQEGAVICNIGT
jgi:hypothetical protein